DPARGPPARRARSRIERFGSARQDARARLLRGRACLPRQGLGRATRDRGPSARQRPYNLPRGSSGRAHRGAVVCRGGGGRLRPARHDHGAAGFGGPLPRAHERFCGPGMKHFGALLLKEEKAIFSSPIAYATVAVYLLLMGYTFTAVLF